MADVISSIYRFVLPEVGASDNTWGGKLNGNWSKMEALFTDAFTGGTETDIGALKGDNAPDYFTKPIELRRDSSASILFKTATNVLKGAITLDQSSVGDDLDSLTLVAYDPADGSVQSRIRMRQNGDVAVTVGRFAGDGSGITNLSSTAFPSTISGDRTFSGKVFFTNDGDKQQFTFSDSTNAIFSAAPFTDQPAGSLLRLRMGGAGGGYLRSFVLSAADGNWLSLNPDAMSIEAKTRIYFKKGVHFGSAIAPANNNVASHLDLYNGSYGLSVTANSLNVVSPGAAIVAFVNDATGGIDAQVNAAGISLASEQTIVTKEKGDSRYLNATNLNAGTVPVARLPTSTTERDRILNLVGDTPIGAVGDRAILTQSADTTTNLTAGNNYSGGSLRVFGYHFANYDGGVNAGDASGVTMSGTWQARGTVVKSGTIKRTTEFLRIA